MTILSDFAEYIFYRITKTMDEMTPKLLNFKPVEEANSIHWILGHSTKIAYLLIPQVITETYNPDGWDDNYEEQEHSLEELKSDLRDARENVIMLLSELTEDDLNKEIMIWGSKRAKKQPIFALLGELLHHNGQIAMLIGIKNRLANES